MSPKILQINYKFHLPKAELEQALLAEAHAMADTPGMRWKIWWVNEAEGEGGCVHLFEDDAAVQSFLAGPLVAEASVDPNFSNMSAKIFDVLPEPTAITRGPV
jgi:hypothetical protein